jgi:transcriptional regulator with XRE-family HTH domain
MPETTIAQRVRGLVDRLHGGSVNAAAREIGIPQRTLARIVEGRVEYPRADALQKLAAWYGTSIEWLLTGKGEPPVVEQEWLPDIIRRSPRSQRAAATEPNARTQYRIQYLLNNVIGASIDARKAFADLTSAPLDAAQLFVNDLRKDGFHPDFIDAYFLQIEAWRYWLEVAVRQFGAQAVRGELERRIPEMQRRFTLVGDESERPG